MTVETVGVDTRRNLVHLSGRKESDGMGDHQPAGEYTFHVITALNELIDALDRRVPHIERAGEIQIARDAARLRNEAVERITELRSAGSDHDTNLVNAVMSDDGGVCLRD